MTLSKAKQLIRDKRKLCEAALAAFDSDTSNFNYPGLCRRLIGAFEFKREFVNITPAYETKFRDYSGAPDYGLQDYDSVVEEEVKIDLKRHLGEPDDAWVGAFSKQMPRPYEKSGIAARRKLLQLAVKHYTSKLKDERAYLKHQNKPYNNGR